MSATFAALVVSALPSLPLSRAEQRETYVRFVLETTRQRSGAGARRHHRGPHPARALLLKSAVMTFQRQQLGMVGEDLAVAALIARGYAILERRYTTERGEIDVIAEDGETLVFVEVRARATGECGAAAESVTRGKQLQVTRVAIDYLARHQITDRPCRFDVVAIDRALDATPEITVYVAAFDAV